MAQSGGNRKNSSKLQQQHYKSYKLENRAKKNKIKKLQRHCKNFPKDEISAKNLERIKKEGYNGRSKPLTPGSNRPIHYIFNFRKGEVVHPETAGEQLSKLLGIPLRDKTTKRKKPKIIRKRRRNASKT